MKSALPSCAETELNIEKAKNRKTVSIDLRSPGLLQSIEAIDSEKMWIKINDRVQK
jgi:hypothetical protein